MSIKKTIDKLIADERKIAMKRANLEYKVLVEKSLPNLRKAVGKCFKYQNTYGVSDHCRRWPLYIKIIEINEENMNFTAVQFQKTTLDRIDIEYRAVHNYKGENYFNNGYEEISSSEYNRAKKSLLKFVNDALSK